MKLRLLSMLALGVCMTSTSFANAEMAGGGVATGLCASPKGAMGAFPVSTSFGYGAGMVRNKTDQQLKAELQAQCQPSALVSWSIDGVEINV